MTPLDNMEKGLASAWARANHFIRLAERVKSKRTEQAGDIFPALDPADGKAWKDSTLQRHRKACAAAYLAMADYWASTAADLRAAIAKETERLEKGGE
jgi:hypothetical protein